ncbi:MAG: hypothetical protein V3S07_04080, partial [Micropepsaceae bacterium]
EKRRHPASLPWYEPHGRLGNNGFGLRFRPGYLEIAGNVPVEVCWRARSLQGYRAGFMQMNGNIGAAKALISKLKLTALDTIKLGISVESDLAFSLAKTPCGLCN